MEGKGFLPVGAGSGVAWFIAQKGLVLSRCEIWSSSHTHPAEKIINSQTVAKINDESEVNGDERLE
jgi:hypothetical protein